MLAARSRATLTENENHWTATSANTYDSPSHVDSGLSTQMLIRHGPNSEMPPIKRQLRPQANITSNRAASHTAGAPSWIILFVSNCCNLPRPKSLRSNCLSVSELVPGLPSYRLSNVRAKRNCREIPGCERDGLRNMEDDGENPSERATTPDRGSTPASWPPWLESRAAS